MKQMLTPSLWADLVFLNLLLLVSAGTLWPLYQTVWLVVVAFAALAAGNAVALVSIRNRWSPWRTALVAVGVYVVGALVFSVPEIYRSPSRIGVALLGVVGAPVTGWKNLLTLELPVGTYREVLAPVFLLLFLCSLGCLLIAWRSRRWWAAAVPVAWLPVVFAAAFGTRAVWRTAFPSISWQLVLGLVGFMIGLGWVVWRLWAYRRNALLEAEGRAGATVEGTRSKRPLRWVLGAAMVCVAVVGSVLTTPTILAGESRSTLRSGVDPDLFLAEQLSPLSTYREFFTEESYSELLFSVEGPAERVRLATLNHFDGSVATAVGTDSQAAANSFVRVPHQLPTEADAETVAVSIDGYTGAWVPLAGDLESIYFEGPRRNALEDGFFYNSESATGIQTAAGGLTANDAYTLGAAPNLVAASEVSQFRPANSGGWADEDTAPDSVRKWIAEQDLGHDGASLLELISRLRSRGYLSHSLVVPTDEQPAWAADLAGIAVAPSRAGHSAARINTLFTDMLERQTSLPADADPSLLVSAVGDDEQFAVAAALIADQLGFDVRIAVGAVLARETDDPSAIPTCDGGSCYGRNMTAWIEVRDGESGTWAAIDVTPQHEVSPKPDPEQRSDPKNFTPVQPKSVEALPPPAPSPRDSAEAPEVAPQPEAGPELSIVWRIIAFSVLGVMLLMLPFVAILALKALRRSRRKNSPDPRDRVIGGWDEFVDGAVDHGLPRPGTQTRSELAAVYVGHDPGATYLATGADFAAFSSDAVSDADAMHYWRVLGSVAKTVNSSEGAHGKLRARLSLKSLSWKRGARR